MNNVLYPGALSKVLNNEFASLEDPVIYLNNNTNLWYFKGDEDVDSQSKYDFQTAVLRAIGQALGFQSTIRDGGTGQIDFGLTHNSIFDTFIVNSSRQYLKDFPRGSTGIAAFARGDNVFWKSASNHRLYAPAEYEEGYSLSFFNDPGSLMSAKLSPNQRIEKIDEKTTSVLEDIGWNIAKPSLSIFCNTIGSNGLASIHNSYSFEARTLSSTSSLTDISWEYNIALKEGGYTTISTGNSSTFSISPISPNPAYARNSDGYIIAHIALSAKVDGVSQNTEFILYLQTSPDDIKYSIHIIKESDWYFNVEVFVESSGADELTIDVVDYIGGESYYKIFKGKSYVKYSYRYFTYDSPITFNFRSKNSFGEKTATKYIEAVRYSDTDRIDETNQNEVIDKVNIYNMTGNFVTSVRDVNALEALNLSAGIYHLTYIYKSGKVKTIKMLR